MKEQRLQVRLSNKMLLAEGIMGIELQSINGEKLPEFSAGSHVDVELPGGFTRQYSLCNSPDQNDRYELGVLLESEGRGGSHSVHHVIAEGDSLVIGTPRNNFPIEESAGYHLLLAGGIGITPLLSMSDALHRSGRDFSLHYCGRNRKRMAFLDRVENSEYSGNVFVYPDEDVAGLRFEADAIIKAAPKSTHLYVCGPAGFIEHVLNTARARGWEESRLHYERFSASPRESQQKEDTFEVEMKDMGISVLVSPDKTVAEALMEAGVDVNLSCEQGICGSCAMKVVSGEPDHRDMFFSDEEHASGLGFTPCCSRAHSARLVLEA